MDVQIKYHITQLSTTTGPCRRQPMKTMVVTTIATPNKPLASAIEWYRYRMCTVDITILIVIPRNSVNMKIYRSLNNIRIFDGMKYETRIQNGYSSDVFHFYCIKTIIVRLWKLKFEKDFIHNNEIILSISSWILSPRFIFFSESNQYKYCSLHGERQDEIKINEQSHMGNSRMRWSSG